MKADNKYVNDVQTIVNVMKIEIMECIYKSNKVDKQCRIKKGKRHNSTNMFKHIESRNKGPCLEHTFR